MKKCKGEQGYRLTDQRTDLMKYAIACTRLKKMKTMKKKNYLTSELCLSREWSLCSEVQTYLSSLYISFLKRMDVVCVSKRFKD